MTIYERGLDCYSLTILERLAKDLRKNPETNVAGTWENLRSTAVEKTIRKMKRAAEREK